MFSPLPHLLPVPLNTVKGNLEIQLPAQLFFQSFALFTPPVQHLTVFGSLYHLSMLRHRTRTPAWTEQVPAANRRVFPSFIRPTPQLQTPFSATQIYKDIVISIHKNNHLWAQSLLALGISTRTALPCTPAPVSAPGHAHTACTAESLITLESTQCFPQTSFRIELQSKLQHVVIAAFS